MKPLAEPAFTLPAGIAPSDLAFISQYVAIIAAVFAVVGILLLKRFAGRSISFMVAIVVAVCTLTSMAGVGVIAYRMVGTPSVRDEVLDLMAIAGLAVATRRGIDVPGRLSVTGYDNTELAAHVQPSLTSVSTDVIGWGRAAAKSLLELVDQRPATDVQLPQPRLVVRGSSGPAPLH